MATIWMIDAVQRNSQGDVTRVRWGKVETTIGQGRWHEGDPHEDGVIAVVDELMASTDVWARMPNGAPGPNLRVISAKVGQGVETIELVDNRFGHTVADLAQF